jgi:cell division protein ZapA
MSEITIKVSGHQYSLACRDGEEKRLGALAEYVDSKAKTLIDNLGQVGESRLLLMSALLIADELDESREQAAKGSGGADLERLIKMMDKTSEAIEGIAERLEST